MPKFRPAPIAARWPFALLLALLAAPVLFAQSPAIDPASTDPAVDSADPLTQLQAEMSVTRTLLTPQDPINIRFTVYNPTDMPIELPLVGEEAAANALALPMSFVFGLANDPALLVEHSAGDMIPSPILPHPTTPTDRTLTLAPHGVLGAVVDLRSRHRLFRYPGEFELTWRPLDGAIEPGKLRFRVEARKRVIMTTDYGKLNFALNYDTAPRNVENFLELCRDKFYDGTSVFMLVPGGYFMAGSPDGTNRGIRPDGKLIPAELTAQPFREGLLAMARKPNDPDSASCIFFVTLGRAPELDGEYTIIGEASDEPSMRTLSQLTDLPVDERFRPLKPLSIQFVTLVDAEEARTNITVANP